MTNNRMRVLVCGSRDWTDQRIVYAVLDGLDDEEVDTIVIIEGGAKGADTFAAQKAKASRWEHEQYPADWMLDEGKPDLVVAFKDGFHRDQVWDSAAQKLGIEGAVTLAKGGTEDMVRRAKAAGIPVYIVSHG